MSAPETATSAGAASDRKGVRMIELPKSDPADFARQQLLALPAKMVRMAHEVEALCDCVSGKGGPRARAEASRVANRLRAAAMSADAVRASER